MTQNEVKAERAALYAQVEAGTATMESIRGRLDELFELEVAATERRPRNRRAARGNLDHGAS